MDDALSRAEFKKRPELHRVLAAAVAGTIDVVVTRDETRIGGDRLRAGLWISELKDAGARLFYGDLRDLFERKPRGRSESAGIALGRRLDRALGRNDAGGKALRNKRSGEVRTNLHHRGRPRRRFGMLGMDFYLDVAGTVAAPRRKLAELV